jgi:hypothetical protein
MTRIAENAAELPEGAPMTAGADSTEPDLVPVIDTSVAHQARVYDYWLGGKDNFAADRAVGDMAIEVSPNIVAGVRANREFLGRAVRYLAAEAGVRQFLDIGSGLPAASNTHEIAQAAAPDARVVYVDNDPIVLAHARALLTSAPQGACAYLDADANEPETFLARTAETLDFAQPVAVAMLAVLQVLRDPQAVIDTVMKAVPSGSYLILSVPSSDIHGEQQAALASRVSASTPGVTVSLFSGPQVRGFLGGLDLVDPGVTTTTRWRPEPTTSAEEFPVYVAVARKP